MIYTKVVRSYIEEQKVGTPIFTSDVLEHILKQTNEGTDCYQLRQNLHVILMRLAKKEEVLRRYGSGIYFRSQPGAETEINAEELVKRSFIEDKAGNVFGYYTGEIFARELGITLHMPEEVLIATNERRNMNSYAKRLGVRLLNPPAEVTSDNVRYLQLLDLLKLDVDLSPSRSRRPALLKFMQKNQLNSGKLVAYASEYYSQKVVVRAAELISSRFFQNVKKRSGQFATDLADELKSASDEDFSGPF